MAGPLEKLGEIAYRSGDLADARRHLEEALQLVRGICKVCTESLLSELADVIGSQGDNSTMVASLLYERDTLRVELGLPAIEPWTI
jgi:hypothetical protein